MRALSTSGANSLVSQVGVFAFRFGYSLCVSAQRCARRTRIVVGHPALCTANVLAGVLASQAAHLLASVLDMSANKGS